MITIPKEIPAFIEENILPLTAMVVFGGALSIILAALAFEHIGGYKPCPLCLQQRWAYYFAIPLAALAIPTSLYERRDPAVLALVLIAAAFAVNAVLGAHHAGVEWGFWQGPTGCTGSDLTAPGSDLLGQLSKTQVVRCDEPSWRFLGISFAGYNALISAGLAVIAFAGGWLGWERKED